MKLLEKENVVAPRVRAYAPAVAPKPQIAVRVRVAPKSLPRRRDRSLVESLNRVVAFAAIFGLTYVGSTLMGYVALERARQAARLGEDRATFARAEAKSARTAIEALTNPSELHAWADAHGFVAGAGTEPSSNAKPAPRKALVAQR